MTRVDTQVYNPAGIVRENEAYVMKTSCDGENYLTDEHAVSQTDREVGGPDYSGRSGLQQSGSRTCV